MMALDKFFVEYLREKIDPKGKILAGLALKLIWKDKVSNTHDAPRNGVTNWGGRTEGAPTGYPGWSGRIWVRYYPPVKSTFGHDPVRGARVFTGTGGFGHYDGPWQPAYSAWYELNKSRKRRAHNGEPQCYSYDVRIFADDFPELLFEYNCVLAQLRLEGRLYREDWLNGGNMVNHPELYYVYTNPEIQQQDEQLIAKCRLQLDAQLKEKALS
jgi:hypothetical protein